MQSEQAIDPKELRIGNRLSPRRVLDPENIPLAGYSICAGHIAYSIERLNYDWGPIRLTPEILEKVGFVNFPSGNIDRWKKGRLYLESNWLGSPGEYKFKWENMDHTGSTPNTKIQYLHQLQNLFFALQGTELEIKL
jgi:hypothetical protein